MTRFTRILCPVDLSSHSRLALDQAVALARHAGGSVIALHVIPPVTPVTATLEVPAAYVYTPDELAEIEANVRSFVEQGHADAGIEVRVLQGYIVDEILATATGSRADVIVLGTHGRSGFQRFILGSIAERVLARATCPVMTIPPSAQATPSDPAMFRHVLCAFDFSPASQAALSLATELADDSGAILTVVHVIEPASLFEPVAAGLMQAPPSMETARDTAVARLREALPKDASGQTRAREMILTGKPYQAILRAAHDTRCDLLVVGAHGGLASVLGIGSTTNHVVRAATCPVITMRS